MEALSSLVLMSVLALAGAVSWALSRRRPSLPQAYADQILSLEQRRLALEEKRVEAEGRRESQAHELEAAKQALEARKVALAEGQAALQKERHGLEMEMARERSHQGPRGRHIPSSMLERA